jgi:hypothetical protein
VKRVLAALIAVSVVLVWVVPAGAATPTERKVAALQRQVKTLQRSVTTLRRQVRDLNLVASFALNYEVCLTAATADALTGTWSVIDAVAQTAQGRTHFGQQLPVNDIGSCDRLRVRRQTTGVPSTGVFSSLTTLLAGRVAAFPWRVVEPRKESP